MNVDVVDPGYMQIDARNAKPGDRTQAQQLDWRASRAQMSKDCTIVGSVNGKKFNMLTHIQQTASPRCADHRDNKYLGALNV